MTSLQPLSRHVDYWHICCSVVCHRLTLRMTKAQAFTSGPEKPSDYGNNSAAHLIPPVLRKGYEAKVATVLFLVSHTSPIHRFTSVLFCFSDLIDMPSRKLVAFRARKGVRIFLAMVVWTLAYSPSPAASVTTLGISGGFFRNVQLLKQRADAQPPITYV